jgi:hypothetical protein
MRYLLAYVETIIADFVGPVPIDELPKNYFEFL